MTIIYTIPNFYIIVVVVTDGGFAVVTIDACATIIVVAIIGASVATSLPALRGASVSCRGGVVAAAVVVVDVVFTMAVIVGYH